MENLYKRIDHVSYVIPLIEEKKIEIVKSWMQDEDVIHILAKKQIKIKLFAERFPLPIINYLIGVLKHENKIGDCPEILKMIIFFKSVHITVADVFRICMGLRKSLFKEVLESETFLEQVSTKEMIESFETVHAVFDANLAGVLNSYTKTISEFNKALTKQIKENKEKDQIMALQARQAAMGEIITMLAHQWRQPLATINMMISNVLIDFEMETVDFDHVKHNLDEASRNIITLSETIDEFRKFFKKTEAIGPVSLGEIKNDLLHLIAQVLKEHGISFQFAVGDEKVFINTIRQELVQVLLNIINNAKEALLARKVSSPKIELKSEIDDTGVHLIINDNAGGIDESVLPHIFEPYFSTKPQQNGMGVGLYIARLITEKHLNGKIEAVNGKEGALFTLTLFKRESEKAG